MNFYIIIGNMFKFAIILKVFIALILIFAYEFYQEMDIFTEITKKLEKPQIKTYLENYASLYGGAIIIEKTSFIKNAEGLLQNNRDKYAFFYCYQMINIVPYVIIALKQQIYISKIQFIFHQIFSNHAQTVQILISSDMIDWQYIKSPDKNISLKKQFMLKIKQSVARYVKIRFIEFNQKWTVCTISQVKVYGKTLYADAQKLHKNKLQNNHQVQSNQRNPVNKNQTRNNTVKKMQYMQESNTYKRFIHMIQDDMCYVQMYNQQPQMFKISLLKQILLDLEKHQNLFKKVFENFNQFKKPLPVQQDQQLIKCILFLKKEIELMKLQYEQDKKQLNSKIQNIEFYKVIFQIILLGFITALAFKVEKLIIKVKDIKEMSHQTFHQVVTQLQMFENKYIAKLLTIKKKK